MSSSHVWQMRSPEGGAKGLEFALAEMDATYATVLVHAAPSVMRVVVTSGDDVVARADDLRDDARSTPMSRLRMADGSLSRENIWPGEDDIGLPVILPGGEVGILLSWWNADDESEWTWRIELHNRA